MILTPHIVINSDHNNKLENAVKGHTWDRKCAKAFSSRGQHEEDYHGARSRHDREVLGERQNCGIRQVSQRTYRTALESSCLFRRHDSSAW